MKSIKKYRILLVLTLFTIIFLISTNLNTISHLFNPNFDQNNNKNVKNAGSWFLPPIEIDGNGQWSSTNKTQPWCNGNGTWYDPYIIENVTIDAQGSWACMDIQNSDVFFEIRNCTLYNGNAAGVYLNKVQNGKFFDLNCTQTESSYGSATGINCRDCINLTFKNNTILNHLGEAIFIYDCNSSNIEANNLTGKDFRGIEIMDCWYSNFSYNRMDNCGIMFYPFNEENPKSIKIEKTNTVNGNPVYYYVDRNGLYSENFSTPGQIILANCNDSLITDFNISGTSEGISMYFCTNNTIFNNSLSFSRLGIRSTNGINNSIIANIGNNILYEGIYINNEIDCNITDNDFSVLSETHGYGISIDGLNCTLTNNSLKNCGIEFDGGPTNFNSYNVDTSNTVNNKPIYFYKNQNNLDANYFNNAGQIFLFRCNNSLISDVNVSNGSEGIFLYDCTDVLISHINASYNRNTGIYIRNSENINISDNNVIQNADEGIRFSSSSFNNIFRNMLLNNNEDGLAMSLSSNSNISHNLIANNKINGIEFEYECKNNSVSLNNITGNNLGIRVVFSNDSTFYGNNFIGNTEHARDDNGFNFWNSIYLGNYWDNYTDNDLNPKDGIGDVSYVISGSSNSEDYKPVMGPIWGDLDGDGLSNLEELTPGSDTFVTNASNPDTDYDGMPDGWEFLNSLDATDATDKFKDVDNDFLLNLYEYLNGTDPQNADCDGDTFLDGIEASAIYSWWTDPLNKWWYPMPNLEILDFKAKAAKENVPFTLNFTIINNGIWRAENVFVRIKLELGNLTLWDNFDDPIDLEVDVPYHNLIQIEGVNTSGGLAMILELDPFDSINETYSSQDGSLRIDAEYNTEKTDLEIEEAPDGGGGLDLIYIILIIFGAVAFAGTVSSYAVLRPRIKRRAAFKRQIETAKTEIENFEIKIHSFIKLKLRDAYKKQWWEDGIPLYIRNTIDKKLKTIKSKKPEGSIDKMDLLDFIHYSSIFTSQDNWEQIFSPIFPDKSELKSNFENLRVFKKDLYEGTVTLDDIRNYPLFIHAIGNLITERFNIFLSYSTLDSEYYNIKEIASQLESYPKIDKVLYWEIDSGEDIVKYMERTLRISKVFVLFCTEKSFKSKAVEDEWHSAFQLRKEGKMKIVPVYEQQEYIPYLLKPLLNVKFDKDNFDEFVRKLYDEILR